MKKALMLSLSALSLVALTSCGNGSDMTTEVTTSVVPYVDSVENYLAAIKNTYDSKNLVMNVDYKEISEDGSTRHAYHSEVRLFDYGYDEKMISSDLSDELYSGMRFFDSACVYYDGPSPDSPSYYDAFSYSEFSSKVADDPDFLYYPFENFDDLKKYGFKDKKDIEEKCWDYFMNAYCQHNYYPTESVYGYVTYLGDGLYIHDMSDEERGKDIQKLKIENGYLTEFYMEFEYEQENITVIYNVSLHDFGGVTPKEISFPKDLLENITVTKEKENE